MCVIPFPTMVLRFPCVCALLLVACSAVYPELKTPIRPALGELEAPPKDLRWIAFKGANVPRETRDGRKWDAVGGHAPDPYAVLFVNGQVLFKTPVQSNTLAPTWPDAPAGNVWIRDTDKFRVEIWDSNPINDHPIGVKDLGSFDEEIKLNGKVEAECDSGASVVIAVEPAHAKVGLGISYELRLHEVFVTQLYDQSPASRAGIRIGDRIMELDGMQVAKMKDGEVQSAFNAPHLTGLNMRVRHKDGTEIALALKEGAIFPLFSEDRALR
jgi:hypothetical protein